MVGWEGKPAWAAVDLFNLFDVNPHTTDLTWELVVELGKLIHPPTLVNTKSLKLIKTLTSGGPGIVPPPGVSARSIYDFKSDLFDILYPFETKGDTYQRGDATAQSRKELREELKKINAVKLEGYQKTWDAENGKPGSWLGAAIRTGTSSAYQAFVEDYPDGAEERPILIEEDGTQDDPITLSGEKARTEARVDNTMALVRMPMHQRNQFMQLGPWKASPANFRYVIAPRRLREMAKSHIGGNRYSIVIGVVRRPTWNVEETYPEYICVASLEGGRALTIRVKMYSVEGEMLEKWPGGGQNYTTLESIKERGYLFRPFCDNFDKERLRAYLQKMGDMNHMPRVRMIGNG